MPTIHPCRRLVPLLCSLLPFLLLATTARVQAASVDRSTALEAAAAFLHGAAAGTTRIVQSAAIGEDPQPLAYIFCLEPTGYVAVAGDDRLPPVIAYSFESDYPANAGPANPLAQMLAADLASRLTALATTASPAPTQPHASNSSASRSWSDWIVAFDRDDRFAQWPPAGSTPTGGWLASNWTQNAPYSNLCPLDLAHGGTRSLAGCPAVAMAMILNYNETVQGTSFGAGDRYWHNYQGNAYWIPDAAVQYGFPDFATLNGYLQTLTSHWSQGTALTNTDKAALTFGCGIAARQVYAAAGSGTFGVDQAYDAYLRFGFDGCRLVFDSDPQMYPDLAAQMQNALPAHLAVVDPGWTMGHNVVVDGYNTDNYYHLNFGWGGAYNGWYLLPQEIPYGLTVVEGIVLDIVPNTTAVTEIPAGRSSLMLGGGPNPFRDRVVMSFQAPAAGHARLAIYDIAGRLLTCLLDGEVPAGPRSTSWTPDRLAAGVYLARLELGGRVETRQVTALR